MIEHSTADAYAKLTIKKYMYWTLYLHEDQRYLGRAYAWLKREGEMQDFFDLHPQEEFELFRIAHQYKRALAKLWKPDHMNYVWLGNLIKDHGGHGHMHLIPRYKVERIFAYSVFVDGNWGKNYAPYISSKPFEAVLVKIRDAIKENI